jgi:hypothetical protein
LCDDGVDDETILLLPDGDRIAACEIEKHILDAQLLPASTAPQAQPAPCVVDDQTKTRHLIALCEKDQPLSASDVAAIQQLLAADASVACGIGQSK